MTVPSAGAQARGHRSSWWVVGAVALWPRWPRHRCTCTQLGDATCRIQCEVTGNETVAEDTEHLTCCRTACACHAASAEVMAEVMESWHGEGVAMPYSCPESEWVADDAKRRITKLTTCACRSGGRQQVIAQSWSSSLGEPWLGQCARQHTHLISAGTQRASRLPALAMKRLPALRLLGGL